MTDPLPVISVDCDDWTDALPGLEDFAVKIASSAWRAADKPENIPDTPLEISIVFSDDDTVHKLNAEYLGKDRPTNVLSFPQFDWNDDASPQVHDADAQLGDVILAFQTMKKEADEAGKTLESHTAHLITHGVLHLLGYDHEEDDEAEKMESLESDILLSLGYADPYA